MLMTLASVLLAGCSTLPPQIARSESLAPRDTADTRLGQITAPVEALHLGQSGLHFLPDGLDALKARLAMVDLAERSVDVQTYEWKSDRVGGLLAARLWHAAERGVHVRVLVDDFLLGSRDFNLAAFDAHPNIEVRIFNPFSVRLQRWPFARLFWAVELTTNLQRLNHRMHNKTFVVDNQMAILGGRNVADHYYGLSEEHNMVDFDMLLAGPAVKDASVGFDAYWNSDFAYPVTTFVDSATPPDTALAIQKIKMRLDADMQAIGITDRMDIAQESLERFIAKLSWAVAEIVFDDPDKARGGGKSALSPVGTKLREHGLQTQSELIIISPYFVPGPVQGTVAGTLRAAGVTVKILTNSLASTNQALAHTGYARYRRELVESGIEMHELRPFLPSLVRDPRVPWSTGKATLHAKVMLFDRKSFFVGTFNLDPRSIKLNTEMGLIVHDPELAEQIGQFADTLLEGDASWRVQLDSSDNLVWVGEDDEQPVVNTHEPQASMWRRFLVRIASFLPIESQL